MDKKEESNFPFIEDEILRGNLDITFNLVVKLISLLDSPDFTEDIRSGFRKMIITNTASIIEGLLLYMLEKSKTEDELSTRVIEFKVKKVIHEIDGGTRIVLGSDTEKIEKCKFDKLNLNGMINLCKEHKVIKDAELLKDLVKVRDLRNKQHIGKLKAIDRGYSAANLEFVFSVASRVKKLANAIT